jgi:hypothetical protein
MKEYNERQSTTEVLPYTADFTEALQEGETISSVNITHVPPLLGGSALTPTPATSGFTGTVLLGPLTGRGWHVLKMQAVGSAGSKPEVHWNINVS